MITSYSFLKMLVGLYHTKSTKLYAMVAGEMSSPQYGWLKSKAQLDITERQRLVQQGLNWILTGNFLMTRHLWHDIRYDQLSCPSFQWYLLPFVYFLGIFSQWVRQRTADDALQIKTNFKFHLSHEKMIVRKLSVHTVCDDCSLYSPHDDSTLRFTLLQENYEIVTVWYITIIMIMQ